MKIHTIWIQGYEYLPIENKISYDKIKKLNEEMTFIFWDDTSIIKLLKKYPRILNLYYNINHIPGFENSYAIKSDIARYMILKEYGGMLPFFFAITSKIFIV